MLASPCTGATMTAKRIRSLGCPQIQQRFRMKLSPGMVLHVPIARKLQNEWVREAATDLQSLLYCAPLDMETVWTILNFCHWDFGTMHEEYLWDGSFHIDSSKLKPMENRRQREYASCPVCWEPLDDDLVTNSGCGHILHRACWAECLRYQAAQIAGEVTVAWELSRYRAFICVGDGCTCLLSATIMAIAETDEDVRTAKDSLFVKAFRSKKGEDIHLTRCPASGCNDIHVIHQDAPGELECEKVRYCPCCRLPSHSPATCYDAEEWVRLHQQQMDIGLELRELSVRESVLLQESERVRVDRVDYDDQGNFFIDHRYRDLLPPVISMALVKKCPGSKCDAQIEKVGGCDHVVCTRCRLAFCWSCLTPLTGEYGYHNCVRRDTDPPFDPPQILLPPSESGAGINFDQPETPDDVDLSMVIPPPSEAFEMNGIDDAGQFGEIERSRIILDRERAGPGRFPAADGAEMRNTLNQGRAGNTPLEHRRNRERARADEIQRRRAAREEHYRARNRQLERELTELRERSPILQAQQASIRDILGQFLAEYDRQCTNKDTEDVTIKEALSSLPPTKSDLASFSALLRNARNFAKHLVILRWACRGSNQMVQARLRSLQELLAFQLDHVAVLLCNLETSYIRVLHQLNSAAVVVEGTIHDTLLFLESSGTPFGAWFRFTFR